MTQHICSFRNKGDESDAIYMGSGQHLMEQLLSDCAILVIWQQWKILYYYGHTWLLWNY